MSTDLLKDFRDALILLPADHAVPAGTKLGWGKPVYPGFRPKEQKGECLTLVQYDGVQKILYRMGHARIQATVYHTAQETARQRAQQLFTALHDKHGWTLSSDWKAMLITCTGPQQLPQEQSTDCYRATVNIDVAYKEL